MHCRNCGSEIDKNAVVCVKCGFEPLAKNNHCQNCGEATTDGQKVCTGCGVILKNKVLTPGPRNKIVAAILALFLGGFGIHKFYLGSWGLGIIYILLFLTFIPSIVSFVEFIIFLVMDDNTFERKYNQTPTHPFKW